MTNPARPDAPPPIHPTCRSSEPVPASPVPSRTGSRKAATTSRSWPGPVPPEGRWTERHRLVSFYASDEVRDWIDQEMRRTGESKTQVIVHALEKQRRSRRSSGGRRPRSAR